MLTKYRYGLAVFVAIGILISLFPPINRELQAGAGAIKVQTVTFRFLFSSSDRVLYYTHEKGISANDALFNSGYGLNGGLITVEYIFAALLGISIELVFISIRKKE
jgi:hypothetical protein